MGVPMPPVVVLVFCKVVLAGPADQNAGYTGHQNLQWDTEHSQMICRRQEIQLFDMSAAQGADPKPFSQFDCWRSGFQIGAQWDATHQTSKYRFWRTACPVKVVNSITGEVIAWKIPECGRYDGTVVCEGDITL
jgi:hypothetical protein